MYKRESSKRIHVISLICISIVFLVTCSHGQTPNQKSISLKDSLLNHLIPQVQIQNDPIYYSLKERMKYYNVPGFSLAFKASNNEAQYLGEGFSNVEKKVKIDSETKFQVGSISKSITAILVLKLHANGILDINEDIRSYLHTWSIPENKFTQERKITLKQLLSHTSGIKGAKRMKLDQVGYGQDMTSPSLNEILDGLTPLQKLEFDTFPGLTHRYSNQGFNLIQKIIEDITSVPFEELAQSVILEPFKMYDSHFKIIYSSDQNKDYAISYKNGLPKEGGWRHNKGKCSGGLYSTPKDLIKFITKVAKIVNHKDDFISRDLANLLTQGDTYSLGFDLIKTPNKTLLAHSGRSSGYFAYTIIDTSNYNAFAMMTNSDDANKLFAEVLRSACYIFNWDFAQPKMISTTTLNNNQKLEFIGEYRYKDEEETETLKIILNEGKLAYFVVEEETPVIYPLEINSNFILYDLIDGNKLRFVKEGTKIIKLIYDEEYEYIKI